LRRDIRFNNWRKYMPNFLGTTGLDAPTMPGKPAATRGSTGSPLSPGCVQVTSFEAAKEYARGIGPTDGSYTPLDRPGRVASRFAFPDADANIGIKSI
jgi:hypothetical protein